MCLVTREALPRLFSLTNGDCQCIAYENSEKAFSFSRYNQRVWISDEKYIENTGCLVKTSGKAAHVARP